MRLSGRSSTEADSPAGRYPYAAGSGFLGDSDFDLYIFFFLRRLLPVVPLQILPLFDLLSPFPISLTPHVDTIFDPGLPAYDVVGERKAARGTAAAAVDLRQ